MPKPATKPNTIERKNRKPSLSILHTKRITISNTTTTGIVATKTFNFFITFRLHSLPWKHQKFFVYKPNTIFKMTNCINQAEHNRQYALNHWRFDAVCYKKSHCKQHNYARYSCNQDFQFCKVWFGLIFIYLFHEEPHPFLDIYYGAYRTI